MQPTQIDIPKVKVAHYKISQFQFQDCQISMPSPSKLDKIDQDKRVKLMHDILKTNQKHIEHLKDMVESLKKVLQHCQYQLKNQQLAFEQKQKEDVQKENLVLKGQVQQLKEKIKQFGIDDSSSCISRKNLSSTNLEMKNAKQTQNNSFEAKDNSIGTVMPPTLQNQTREGIKTEKLGHSHSAEKEQQLQKASSQQTFKQDLKINVQNILAKTQGIYVPLTSVKKSINYIHELRDEKLTQAMRRSIVMAYDQEKINKSSSNSTNSNALKKSNSMISSQIQFNFCSPFSDIPRSLTPIQTVLTEENELGSSDLILEKTPSLNQSRSINDRVTSMKESPELQQQIEDPQTQKSQTQRFRLFENFYILGAMKQDFTEFDNDPQVNEGIVPAHILFKSSINGHNIQGKPENSYETIIPEFAYPFGVKAEKLKMNDSFRKLKEIMYSGNKYELLDKFYMFSIKNQNEQNQSPFDSDVLEETNPEHLLYGICLSVYDYIESTVNTIPLTYQNRKKRQFWKFKKTYCFVTYFPLFELFQDVLFQLINIIKMSRILKFELKRTQEQEVLQEIDGENIVKELNKEIIELLESVRGTQQVQFDTQIIIETSTGQVKYQVPKCENIKTDIRLWSASIVRQLFNYRQLLVIFIAIAQEISVVFICQKSSVLTAILHFFHHLIEPIMWIHPIIYQVPESLLTILESPVPVIVGLNLTDHQIKELEIMDKNENLMFVMIDQDVKITTKPLNLLQNVKAPYFDGQLAKLESLMKDNVKIRNPSPGLQQKSTKLQIRFVMDDKDKQNSTRLLMAFEAMIKKFILEKLPKQINFNKDGSIDMNALGKHLLDKSHSKDKDFIKALLKTQHFSYFLEVQFQ